MKKFLEIILQVIKSILLFGKKDQDNTEVVPDNTEVVPDNSDVVPDNSDVVPDNTEVIEVYPTNPEIKDEYIMLSNKELQIYLKKLGLYTDKIDEKIGPNSKKAIKQFNTIFINRKNEIYDLETDKLLRIIYKSYCESKYMSDSDWNYFKNLRKSEYKCKCGGKYCNGYPTEISMRLVMSDQFERNYYNKSINISSGVRCEKHNVNVGGVEGSSHKKGCASDSYINSVKAETRRKYIYVNSTKLPFVTYSYNINSNYLHKTVSL